MKATIYEGNKTFTVIDKEFEGKHEWTYWQKHIEKTLIFFNGIK